MHCMYCHVALTGELCIIDTVFLSNNTTYLEDSQQVVLERMSFVCSPKKKRIAKTNI